MKKALIILLCMSAIGFGGLLLLSRGNTMPPPDTVALNDAVMTAMQSGNHAGATQLLTAELTKAYAGMDAARRSQERRMLLCLGCLLALMTAAGGALVLYCQRSVLSPFRKLRRFAQNVAAGYLDIPLEMDKYGRFGAFTESFDLMREELNRARESERKAGQSKKELVASLSHDIKTPVASIKAVTELMMVKSPDNAAQCEVILSKADQIDLLITNMFHATLEELEQLKVMSEELPSTALYDLIQSADFDHRVKPFTIPECIVTADRTRLQQVLDNIISNSYKYAGSELTVKAYFEEQTLAVEIADIGPGVSPEELPRVFDKFYRGENAAGKSGSGLGLYIAGHLMCKMGGGIECVPVKQGSCVKILLAM